MAKLKVVPAPPPVEEEDEQDCPRCPPVGAPAWMATFADMATLLMAFFVLILSFANFDEVSFKKMTGALREHFGVRLIDVMQNPDSLTILDMNSPPASNPPSPEDVPDPAQSPSPGSEAQKPDPELQRVTELLEEAIRDGSVTVSGENGAVTVRLPEGGAAAELARALAAGAKDIAGPPGAAEGQQSGTGRQGDAAGQGTEPDAQSAQGEAGASAKRRAAIADARLKVALREIDGEGLVDVQQQDDKVLVTIGAGGAFGSGSATLTDEAREIMSRIALAAVADSGNITVTGHTDSVPLTGGQFTDNWGLAAARAASVVRELAQSGGVEPSRLSAISKGESVPVADNGTEAGRSANRRIEILFDFSNSSASP
ncbi:OmpA family protein [Pseudotabrizicola algicola]|uniref:OmpA family protein n=1 Tax=Pseudotabrizicola algicola TaxID=2709381 RepID=A0A6B3RH30_9RHOB|nr:OmpA family protein [Pseudotabrizicola algicola]